MMIPRGTERHVKKARTLRASPRRAARPQNRAGEMMVAAAGKALRLASGQAACVVRAAGGLRLTGRARRGAPRCSPVGHVVDSRARLFSHSPSLRSVTRRPWVRTNPPAVLDGSPGLGAGAGHRATPLRGLAVEPYRAARRPGAAHIAPSPGYGDAEQSVPRGPSPPARGASEKCSRVSAQVCFFERTR